MMKKLMLVAGLVLLVVGASYAQPDSSATLAIVGNDGNIYLYDFATETLAALTTDAIPNQRMYQWPTWSTDGQLAYFGFSLDRADFYRQAIFIRQQDETPQRIYSATDEFFTYAYWSPGDCETGPICRDLAILYTNPDGNLALRRIRSGAKFNITELSVGGPHYWDWSPNGQTMFWARYDERLEVYDVATDSVTRLPETQALQRAVDWSPIDERLLALVAEGRRADLVVFNGEQRQVLVEGLDAPAAYTWSPDASIIAYLEIHTGRLRVVDAQDGTLLHSISDEALAFLWSPDSGKIAYLTVYDPTPITNGEDGIVTKANPQAVPRAEWHIYTLTDQSDIAYDPHIPTETMVYYYQYFDQFAHSHSLWSPDSRYFSYGALTRRGGQVLVIDTEAVGTEPIRLAAGTVGVFSWQS